MTFAKMADMEGMPRSPRRRPAAWAALLFAAGLVPAHYLTLPLLPLGIGVLFLFCLATILGHCLWLRNLCLLFLIPSLAGLRHEIATELLPADHILRAEVFGQQAIFRGRIAGEPEVSGEQTRLVLELEEAETEQGRCRLSGRVLVTARQVAIAADVGDRLGLRGRLRRPPAARNPGAFDYRAFLALQGIYATLSLRQPAQIVAVEALPGPWYYEYLVLPIRKAVRQGISRNLSGAPAGLLRGMLLGEKYCIPEELMENFRLTGLAHALVVSGMNVELLATFLLTGFALCRVPGRIAWGIMVPVAVLYALVTELQPPVVRAALMASAMLVGRLLERPTDIYNSLGLAALLIMAIWPASPMGLSFQLSFAATLGIVALQTPLTRLFPLSWRRPDSWSGQWLIAPLCVTLAALAGTGPLMAYHFQQFSPVGLIANVAAVPLLGLALGLGSLTALVGWCLPWVATAFNACNYLVLEGLIELVEGFAQVPGASLTTPSFGVGFLVWAALLAFLAALMPQRLWARKVGLFALLLGLNLGVWTPLLRPRELEIVFLDVGQGDAAFLRFPDGKTMVVDGGDRTSEFDYGERVLIPFLRYWGVNQIDVVVATHPHGDHLGGLVALLEKMEVKHYLDSGQQTDTWAATRVRELIATKGIHYHRVAAGDTLIGLGGVGGLILHPTAEFVTAQGESPHGLNNGSVALRLTWGSLSLLFAGDLEEETDEAMLRWEERLQARILKVAHHGSPTSSSPRFVAGAKPEIAVVSVGEGNRFGHPCAEVLARYAARGAQVLRTDQCGAVILHFDGRKIRVETALDP